MSELEMLSTGVNLFCHISREAQQRQNLHWSRLTAVCASKCLSLCLSVCLSVPRRIPTLLHGPDPTGAL